MLEPVNRLPLPKIFASVAALASLLVAPVHAQSTRDETVVSPPTPEDAPIAYLIDAESGQVLFAREEDRRFMPASVTKAMTAFLAFELLEDGTLSQDQTFVVSPETFREWRGVGSTMFLGANDRVRLDDLLHGVTTVSANDGAIVLAEGAAGSVAEWTAAMNAKAREIGMTDSYFGTPNGWMDEGKTFTSARDLGLLAIMMTTRHPAKYAHYVGKREYRYGNITQPNHDPLSGIVAGADGIKTGFTNQAGYGYLGSAKRGRQRLVLVVAGSPRASARNRAARDLLEWGFANYDHRRLAKAGDVIGDAEVQGGSAWSVPLATRNGVSVDLDRSKTSNVTTQIVYDGPLQAPIAAGEAVAELQVSIDGAEPYSVPLYAAQTVGEAGLLDRILGGFRNWFT